MSPTQESLQAPTAPPPLALTPDPNLIGIGPIDGPDLRLYADHLAETFEFEAAAARAAEIAWYQERVGPEVCSLMQAATLRHMTIAVCEEFAAIVRLALKLDDGTADARQVERALAEIGNGAKDDPEHRARRARFFGSLPNRQQVPTVMAAEDREFEDMRTRWWAERDDVPASLIGEEDPPLLEPEDVGEAWGVAAAAVFWLAFLAAGIWAVGQWAVRRGR